jgi:hypothetical protein
MSAYELRAVSGPWHIVESGRTEGLCREPLAPDAAVRPLVDLVDLPEERRCLACERTYRLLLTRPVPWPGASAGTAGRTEAQN